MTYGVNWTIEQTFHTELLVILFFQTFLHFYFPLNLHLTTFLHIHWQSNMATTPSPSTFVEMEQLAPDVATPVWPPALRPPLSVPGPLRAPLHFTPTQASTTDFPGTHVQFPHKSPTTGKKPPPTEIVPQQLVMPLCIGSWKGKAIVDTGASDTLLHENLWKELTSQKLHPWTQGPLYLANEEAEITLGWINMSIILHQKVFTIPAVVLSAKALAYAVVLGLDIIFYSGLQINVADQMYSFQSNP